MRSGIRITTPYPPSNGKTGRRYGQLVSAIRAIPAGREFGYQDLPDVQSISGTRALLRQLRLKGELRQVRPGTRAQRNSQQAVYVRL